jgi:hypothetical protein
MQLTLAFLEPPTPTPSPPSRELRDAKGRAEALDILARLIAQAGQPANRKRCLDPTFLRGSSYGLMPEDKRSPVASRRGITIAAAAV